MSRVLKIAGLTKDYRSFAGSGERIAAILSLGLLPGSIRFRALEDLSFAVGSPESSGPGEIVGLIGANGAGKSTLLRILAGVTPPSSGRIEFSGTVRGILELGVGFSPEFNAYENIYYNGRLWGYSHRQLKEGMDEILSFARLREFAARPLKTYSSGMQMRLGFALATFQRSDLVLVDEALAVGDASFQQKSLERLRAFRAAGSLVLVVSHDVALLASVCDRLLLLDQGRLKENGEPARVAESYMQLIAQRSRGAAGSGRALDAKEYELFAVDEAGGERRTFFPGESMELRVRLRPLEDLEDITVGIHIHDSRGLRVFGTNTYLLNQTFSARAGRDMLIRFQLRLHLGPGGYSAGFAVHRGRVHARDCYLWEEGLLDFVVEPAVPGNFEGTSYLEPAVLIEPESP